MIAKVLVWFASYEYDVAVTPLKEELERCRPMRSSQVELSPVARDSPFTRYHYLRFWVASDEARWYALDFTFLKFSTADIQCPVHA